MRKIGNYEERIGLCLFSLGSSSSSLFRFLVRFKGGMTLTDTTPSLAGCHDVSLPLTSTIDLTK